MSVSEFVGSAVERERGLSACTCGSGTDSDPRPAERPTGAVGSNRVDVPGAAGAVGGVERRTIGTAGFPAGFSEPGSARTRS